MSSPQPQDDATMKDADAGLLHRVVPQPYYQRDGITIYHGDCLEITRALDGVDAVVSDPPYGMAWHCNLRSMRGRKQPDGTTSGGRDWESKIHGDDSPFDPSPWLRYRRVVLWGCNHYSRLLPTGTTLVWIKRNDNAFGTFFSDAELAWMKGGTGVFCRRDFSFNSEARRGQRHHPTQKPVSVMRWCIERARIPEGGTVLDPFMGSGSTLLAARADGLNAIGIEIEERYCEIAAKRLSQGVLF